MCSIVQLGKPRSGNVHARHIRGFLPWSGNRFDPIRIAKIAFIYREKLS